MFLLVSFRYKFDIKTKKKGNFDSNNDEVIEQEMDIKISFHVICISYVNHFRLKLKISCFTYWAKSLHNANENHTKAQNP